MMVTQSQGLIPPEQPLVARESPQERRSRCWWLSIMPGLTAVASACGALGVCHTCYRCTCVGVWACIAVRWCALCYPSLELGQTFNATMYYKSFYTQRDGLQPFNLQVKEKYLVPFCFPRWLCLTVFSVGRRASGRLQCL